MTKRGGSRQTLPSCLTRLKGNVVEPTDDERTNSLESFEASQGLHT